MYVMSEEMSREEKERRENEGPESEREFSRTFFKVSTNLIIRY